MATITLKGTPLEGYPTPSVFLAIYVDGVQVANKTVSRDQVVLGNLYSLVASYGVGGSHQTYGVMILENDVGKETLQSSIVSFTVQAPVTNQNPIILSPELTVNKLVFDWASGTFWMDFNWVRDELLYIFIDVSTGNANSAGDLPPSNYTNFWFTGFSTPFSGSPITRIIFTRGLPGTPRTEIGTILGDKITVINKP